MFVFTQQKCRFFHRGRILRISNLLNIIKTRAYPDSGCTVITQVIQFAAFPAEPQLRIEIHEAQNIVERVNSIMGFIFYGKLGEISTNIKDDQELAIACLHLLQACMSYINTLIIQKVLSRPESAILILQYIMETSGFWLANFNMEQAYCG